MFAPVVIIQGSSTTQVVRESAVHVVLSIVSAERKGCPSKSLFLQHLSWWSPSCDLRDKGVARTSPPEHPTHPTARKTCIQGGRASWRTGSLRGADLATAYWEQSPTSVLRSPRPGIISIQGTKRPDHLLRESALVWGWDGSRGWQPPLLGRWREVTDPREPREAAALGGRLFLVQPHHPPVRAGGDARGRETLLLGAAPRAPGLSGVLL